EGAVVGVVLDPVQEHGDEVADRGRGRRGLHPPRAVDLDVAHGGHGRKPFSWSAWTRPVPGWVPCSATNCSMASSSAIFVSSSAAFFDSSASFCSCQRRRATYVGTISW